jgi:predicted nucleic acid-binding protein
LLTRFVDTNVFIYALTAHPRFGETAKRILGRIETGENAMTSTLVLCEVAWVLEAMGRQGSIKASLEKILSYESLDVLGFDESDLMVGANNMAVYGLDFNDGVNVALVANRGVSEIYSNDHAHLGKIEFLKLIFK